jgi:RNA polymerase sigma factor (sigma-70 family)
MLMEKLLQRCQTGDERAIQEMIGKHQAAVYRLTLSILDDPAEAEEATQDTFVAALSALGSFRGESSFSTWLGSIAINLCRNRLKRRQARERLSRTLQSLVRLAGTSQVMPEETMMRQESDSALPTAGRLTPVGRQLQSGAKYRIYFLWQLQSMGSYHEPALVVTTSHPSWRGI